MNTDQRRIPLTPTVVGVNSYSLALPADPGIIIPGMWWLFAIDPAGVPSVGFPMLVRVQTLAEFTPEHSVAPVKLLCKIVLLCLRHGNT